MAKNTISILILVILLAPFTFAVIKIGGDSGISGAGATTSTAIVRLNQSTDFTIFNNALGSCSAGQFVYGFDGNGFKLCSTPAGSGNETDPKWTANITNYFTKADILGFGYYNLTSFDINNYYLKSNPFGYYNVTTLPAETDPKAYNGTLMRVDQWNATNTTYREKYNLTWEGNLELRGNETINSSNLYLNITNFICFGNTTARCWSNLTNNGTHSIWF